MANDTRLLSPEDRTEQDETIQEEYEKLRIETFLRKFEIVPRQEWVTTKPERRMPVQKDRKGKKTIYYILKKGELY